MVKARSELPNWFVELGFKTGAEIGVYKGEFTARFCDVGIFMYAIDPWIAYSEEGSQRRQDFLYGHTIRQLQKFPNCKIIRKTSAEALNDFKDESLDFVYLDGDHSFKSVAFDIEEWTKKVKKGGIVAGHDYHGQSAQFVSPVVDAYVKAYGIKTLETFGSKEYSIKRGDRHTSWLFLKP